MTSQFKKNVKNKLIDLRVKNNLSRSYVADKIGTSEDCIARIENGKQKIILDEHAVRLAKIYEVSLDDIYVASIQKSEL
ncbi:helix-turn-helix transcriptional regulator [Clostridium botulinum]|uniref:Putative helix-turn-helix DNA-binding protein n=1 Tax=Clostridium botulinum TaxID=1491 RepID=A0A140B418_CLOBO|nr:helix-turn-helix transcriptional regulator [Clostridium botulinum]ALP68979.1 putative helix-turn-helix DNA-binding protein [Clostridium botulinum]MBY7043740.1 helix-turn-helix transcriptional regulator [Clostridium botulinum]NFI02387.1 helix-turn-helix transcriptional regulator [Clostridium botulinum]NFI64789.1 helix-turn-helix transcriptional regulator [Clostridium botulinum]NFJ45426.1 helix-turn-helix transcriptional regulator [Clostridium botulinum]